MKKNPWNWWAKPCLGGLAIAASLQGCGGASSVSGFGGSKLPSSQTVSAVADHLAGRRVAMASSSFAAYGTKFSTHSSPFFDGVLGLWARARTGPSIVQETWYPDQTSFVPVGKLNYAVNDVTFTLSGPFSIDSGEFAGLSGTYTQTAQPGGSSGSVNFLNADGTTVVSEFDTKNGGTKFAAGNSSISLSKLSGYSLTESIAYLNTGTSTASAIDSNGISSTLSFKPDLSGTGKVYGNLPGLPAELSWDSTGAGKVLFVDRSVAQLVDWKVATQTPAERHAFSVKIEQPNTRR